jgi:hypothetical protein
MTQGDPGTIVVANGDLELVTFELPGGTPYQLDFNSGLATVWFDRDATDEALSWPLTHFARSMGDFNADNVLDASDVQGFLAALIVGPYDAEADFNEDGLLDPTDVTRFVTALTEGHPADGVILYVRAQSWSQALGDQPLDLWTDPDGDGVFTTAQQSPMTFVYFESFSGHDFGAPIEFHMTPAIPPLAFDENTSAEWEGHMVVTAGVTETRKARFSAEQVRQRNPGQGDILIGDGRLIGGALPAVLTLGSWGNGQAIGRTTFNFNGTIVRTPEFSHTVNILNQFRFNDLVMDPVDPITFLPTYGQAVALPPIVQIGDPSDPQLETYWGQRVALEVPLIENSETIASAPEHITVDLLSYDSNDVVIDSIQLVRLDRDDNDSDPFIINFRSALDNPLIFVDAQIDESAYPDLEIILAEAGGYLVAVRR